ncbi:hypothetical protein M0R45_024635 [Rubus argutus]|uniref:Uncharacterized protein n=1 Tax=Rubus argutus TaxID=59490 RepID=A0AAW1WVM7_RUBAR
MVKNEGGVDGQCLLHPPPAFDVNLYHFTLIGWCGCHVTTGPVLLLMLTVPCLLSKSGLGFHFWSLCCIFNATVKGANGPKEKNLLRDYITS